MAISQEKTPDVSVVIINYLTWETTLELLKSLGDSSNIEIVVIDNGPENHLEKPVLEQYPYVKYLRTEQNIGYAGAVNKGIYAASSDWIMVLNNDTTVDSRGIEKLKEMAILKNYSVAAPRLINVNKMIQNNVGYFDNGTKHLINWIFARPRLINASALDVPTQVDLATGGAILFHRSVIEEIGEWDSRFFMYFEDIDFGMRLKNAHIPVLYVPDIHIGHINSHTANRSPKNKIKNYISSRNRYVTKHRGWFVNLINIFFNAYGVS